MIASALNPRLRVDKLIHRRLQRAYGGVLDPADSNEMSARARDAQFELWLAAWFAMGGKPVDLMEPDLRVPVWFEARGVAAKRIRSYGQIGGHVKKAAEQIAKHYPSGIIALSLDNYSQRRNRSIRTPGTGRRFFEKIEQLRPAARWLVSEAPHIKAVLLFGHVVRWRKEIPPRLEAAHLTQIAVIAPDDSERQHFEDYFEEHGQSFVKAWPHSSVAV